MIIASANINGLRGALLTGKGARTGSGLETWFLPLKKANKIDVLCLQETRIAQNNKLYSQCLNKLKISADEICLQPDENNLGHGGVAIWVNPKTIEVIEIRTPFENLEQTKKHHFSGRWIEADIKIKKTGEIFCVISAYLHHADSPTLKLSNGDLIDRNKSEMTMNNKHIFLDFVTKQLRNLEQRADKENIEVVFTGDFNIAHTDLDIKNFAGNKTKAGFLPEERSWLSLWTGIDWKLNPDSSIQNADIKEIAKTYSKNTDFNYSTPKTEQFSQKMGGFLKMVDVCREKWGTERKYSWWTNMGRAFDNNAGWRLDYQLATPKMARRVKQARIDRQNTFSTRFSDHAPVVVEYE